MRTVTLDASMRTSRMADCACIPEELPDLNRSGMTAGVRSNVLPIALWNW